MNDMAQYNLIHEPWIPLCLRNGQTVAWGIMETLCRSHEVQEVVGRTPLETIALNRFLLAVTHDALSDLVDLSGWKSCWEAGRLDSTRIKAYLEQHASSFDLFHPSNPFYQTTETLVRDPAPLSALSYEMATGNNDTLWSHDLDDRVEPLLPADLAARLVAAQAFGAGSVSGLSGSSVSGGRLPNFEYGPLIGMALFWMRGDALFEALLLNLPPADALKSWRADTDSPAWRLPTPPLDKRSRVPEGMLDYLTWQARRIHVGWDEQQNHAEAVWISQGDRVEALAGHEPMAAYVGVKSKGAFPLRLSPERAVWRDAEVFLGYPEKSQSEGGHPPRTVEWVSNAYWELDERLTNDRPLSLDIFGLVNDQAKVVLWRHERFPLYLSFLLHSEPATIRRQTLGSALDYAEAQVETKKGALARACFAFARRLRFRGYQGERLSSEARAEVRALVDAMGAERLYWASLEPHFYAFLADLARANAFEEAEQALSLWRKKVIGQVWKVFREATVSYGVTAATLQAQAEGEDILQQAYSRKAKSS